MVEDLIFVVALVMALISAYAFGYERGIADAGDLLMKMLDEMIAAEKTKGAFPPPSPSGS